MQQLRNTARLGALALLIAAISTGTVPAQDKDKKDAKETTESKARRANTDEKVNGLLSPMVLKVGETGTVFTFTLDGSDVSVRNKTSFDVYFHNHMRQYLKSQGKPNEDKDGEKEVEKREAVALRAGFDSLHELFLLQAGYEVKAGDRNKRFLSKQEARDLLAAELEKGDKKNRWAVDRLRNLRTDQKLADPILLPEEKK